MNNTTNYSLKKPSGTDNVNIQDQNDNWDSVDQALTPTADPAQTPTSNGPGKLVQWISWIANRIKAITGKTNWWDDPDTTLANAKSHIDAAAPHGGHETPFGAQAKADSAQSAAESYADSVGSNLAGVGRTTENVKQNADDIATHLAESMPHQFLNSGDGKIYRYGFNITTDGYMEMIYEEVV